MNTPTTPRNTLPRNASATLSIAARVSARMRIPNVVVHPVLSGERNFLRDLRASEMAAWEAGLPFAEWPHLESPRAGFRRE